MFSYQKPVCLNQVIRGRSTIVLLGAATIAGVSYAVSIAEPGTLDDTFGVGGKVLTTFPNKAFDEANAVAILSDGKVIAGGITHSPPVTGGCESSNFALVQYTPDGIVDSTFGAGGGAITDFRCTNEEARAIVVQGDGKIVLAGDTTAPNGDLNFALVRYNPNGSIDEPWGNPNAEPDRDPGRVITHFRQVIRSSGHTEPSSESARAVALQPDGKIIAAGWTDSPQGDSNFALVRYNPDGTPDLSFGNPESQPDQNPARVITDFRPFPDGSRTLDIIYGVAIQSDGKIVAVGSTNFPNGDLNFAIVRYNPDGTIDELFGNPEGKANQSPGRVTINFDTRANGDGTVSRSNDEAKGIVIQNDGKIIVAGTSDAPLEQPVSGFLPEIFNNFALLRLNPDGTLDPTYGDSTVFPGSQLTDFDNCALGDGRNRRSQDEGNAIILDGEGRAIVAGSSTAPLNGECTDRGEDRNFALVRYSVNGVPDTGFGPPNNRALTDLEITQAPLEKSSDDEARAIAIMADGRIVAAGRSNAPIANGDQNFALTRYFP
jgi:hypothetical protein